MRYVLLALPFLFVTSFASAQQLSVPEVNYASAQDYGEQKDKVLEVIEYLQHSPANTQKATRRAATSFLIVWLEGTPDITVTLGPIATPFMQYGEGLAIFLGGYTKYALTAPGTVDPLSANLAATQAVLDYYRRNKSVYGYDKELEKLVKKEERGKLEKWVAKQI